MVNVNYGFKPTVRQSPYLKYGYSTDTAEESKEICIPSLNKAYVEFSGKKAYFSQGDVVPEYTNCTVTADPEWTFTNEATHYEETPTRPAYTTYQLKIERGTSVTYSASSFAPIEFGFYFTNLSFDYESGRFSAVVRPYGRITSSDGGVSMQLLSSNGPTVILDANTIDIPRRSYTVNEQVE